MSAPVKNTCPDIDRMQKSLKYAIKEAEYAMKRYEMGQSAQDAMQTSIDEMSTAIDVLEDLRRSNDLLRQWGTEQENRAEQLEEELNKYISL